MKKTRKIGFGVKTRSSGGFGRSSCCIKSQSRELSARAASPGARAGRLSVWRPARAGEIPARAVAKEIPDREFTARAAASPLERPVSGLPLFLSPRWAFFNGLIFYPNFPFIFIAFICFILRILLISLSLLWAFYLSLVLMGLILALGI